MKQPTFNPGLIIFGSSLIMQAANYNGNIFLYSHHNFTLCDGIFYKQGVNGEFHPVKCGVCLLQKNLHSSLCFRKSQIKTLKEASINFYDFILYFDWLKVSSFWKKQGILGILESITAFHPNRDGHSEVLMKIIEPSGHSFAQ